MDGITMKQLLKARATMEKGATRTPEISEELLNSLTKHIPESKIEWNQENQRFEVINNKKHPKEM